MKTILLATNLGPRSQNALERALLIAREHRAALHVRHVSNQTATSTSERLREQVVAGVDRLEHELGDEFGAGFRPASFERVSGDTADAIAAQAEACDADLIIAGLSEASPGALEGTVLERLLMTAGRPLIVVKSPPAHRYERVLAALDFSAAARRALEVTLQIAPGADFTIVHAREAGTDDTLYDRINSTVRNCFDTARRSVGTHEGAVDIRIAAGRVTEVLAEEARRCSPHLVVFGRHDKDRSTGPYLGSGARGILESLDADMLVTPP